MYLCNIFQPEVGKKRAAENALKTPVSDKKAKVATPSGQKTGAYLSCLVRYLSRESGFVVSWCLLGLWIMGFCCVDSINLNVHSVEQVARRLLLMWQLHTQLRRPLRTMISLRRSPRNQVVLSPANHAPSKFNGVPMWASWHSFLLSVHLTFLSGKQCIDPLSGLFCLGHSTARWLCRLTPRPSMVQSEGPLWGLVPFLESGKKCWW